MTEHEHTLLLVVAELRAEIRMLEVENSILKATSVKSGKMIPTRLWDACIELSNTDVRSPSHEGKVLRFMDMVKRVIKGEYC